MRLKAIQEDLNDKADNREMKINKNMIIERTYDIAPKVQWNCNQIVTHNQQTNLVDKLKI